MHFSHLGCRDGQLHRWGEMFDNDARAGTLADMRASLRHLRGEGVEVDLGAIQEAVDWQGPRR